jgi:hypothetical protein
VTSDSDIGRSRPRIDFIMEIVTRRPRPRLPFEAKRLYRSDSIAEYVGTEGLSRLITGTYPTPIGIAGMIGYIQNGTLNEWIARIERRLNQARSEFAIVGVDGPIIAPTILCAALPSTHLSLHANRGGALRVFHSFLLLSPSDS